MKVSIIVAKSLNNVIGNGNKIPWRLKDDMKHFKETTMGHPVIMGRKTFESMGKPLPGRLNIIISRNTDYLVDKCPVFRRLSGAIEYASYIAASDGMDKVFIIGGGQIYDEAMAKGFVDEIYLTNVLADVEGDVYFNHFNAAKGIDMRNWEVSGLSSHDADSNNQFPFKIYKFTKGKY